MSFLNSTFNQQPRSSNRYVEFRFESSLRKYQKKPSKKFKCDPMVCNYCSQRQQKFKGSPHSKNCQHRYERGSQKKDQDFSFNSINMSGNTHKQETQKKQQLANSPCEVKENHLEQRIYESLIRNYKLKDQDNNVSENEQIDDDEYLLNDFDNRVASIPSFNSLYSYQDNREEKEFVKIQIASKSEIKPQKNIPFQISEKSMEQSSQSDELLLSEASDNQKSVGKDESKKNIVQDQMQETKVKQVISQQSQNQQQPQNKQKIDEGQPKQKQQKVVFEGARILIDSTQKSLSISMRMVNKLLKKHQNIPNLIDQIISQRPYLLSLKEKMGSYFSQQYKDIVAYQ